MNNGGMDVDAPADVKKSKLLKPDGSKAGEADGKLEKDSSTSHLSDVDRLTIEDIKEQIRHIERGVATKELRFFVRVVRAMTHIRKKLNEDVYRRLVNTYLPAFQQNIALQRFAVSNLSLPASVFENVPAACRSPRNGALGKAVGGVSDLASGGTSNALPEVEVFLHLLLVLLLLDTARIELARRCSDALMNRLGTFNRRTLDQLAAKCYFYHARAYELRADVAAPSADTVAASKTAGGQTRATVIAGPPNVAESRRIRELLQARLRTATLRNDTETQAVLINVLLRNYLAQNLYEQAELLVSKTTFPEVASNAEWARFLFYVGRIRAVQLDYSEAARQLTMALRKAPQHAAATGFRIAAQKLSIVVHLLLGEIPDRAVFRNAATQSQLVAYFRLTQAVREGNLKRFTDVCHQYLPRFNADGTGMLIGRLRHNVIKTGVRMIASSYSRISLADVAEKLQLGSAEDAEYIVAKAIRDGVIDATLNHERGFVASRERADVYTTREPLAAFQQRAEFCLTLHNQAVVSMRFPPKSYSNDRESAEERRQREEQELESAAKEMTDDDFDSF